MFQFGNGVSIRYFATNFPRLIHSPVANLAHCHTTFLGCTGRQHYLAQRSFCTTVPLTACDVLFTAGASHGRTRSNSIYSDDQIIEDLTAFPWQDRQPPNATHDKFRASNSFDGTLTVATVSLDDVIPYGLAVTLEVKEDVGIPIYQQIRAKLKPQIVVGAGQA